MNKIQKNWLLETFFKRNSFTGWRGIAEKLIETGSCITTKQVDAVIWIGGIGNYIESEKYDGGVDLIKLTFDIKSFASEDNGYFLESYNQELKRIKEEQSKLTEYTNSIMTLTIL